VAVVTVPIAVVCALAFGPLALFVVGVIGGLIADRFCGYYPFDRL
jgi:uncharacterized membrane protein